MQANKTTRHKVQDHIFTSLTSRKKHLASGTTLDRLSFVVYSGPKVIWSLLSVGAEKWIHQIFLWSSSQKKQRAEGWITRKGKFIPKKLFHPVVSFVCFFLTVSGLKGSICQTQQDRNQPGMKPRHGPWRWKRWRKWRWVTDAFRCGSAVKSCKRCKPVSYVSQI